MSNTGSERPEKKGEQNKEQNRIQEEIESCPMIKKRKSTRKTSKNPVQRGQGNPLLRKKPIKQRDAKRSGGDD
jgi:hypothetical protein